MSKFNLRGKLTLTVHNARGLTNRILVGQMDPFCVIHLSNSKDEKFKTKVVKDGHQDPSWEQSYLYNLEGKEELLHCNVWHEGTMSNDHIGRLDLSLDSLDMSNTKRWYQLKDKENFTKQTGEICFSIKFDGSGLPEGSTAFTTNAARIARESGASPVAASSASPIAAPHAYASTTPTATIQPPAVQTAPAPQYNNPPPAVYQQPPPPQNYQSNNGYPGAQAQQQYRPPQQQPQYAPQPQYHAPPPQPIYQAPPQPMYQAPPQLVYQAPMQPVYQSVQYQQQPAPVIYQPAPVVYQTQQPQIVYTQQPGQVIGYWPNGQPRYAGQ